MSIVFDGWVMPALFTRTSTWPNFSITASAPRSRLPCVTSQRDAEMILADVASPRAFGSFGVQIQDGDLRPARRTLWPWPCRYRAATPHR